VTIRIVRSGGDDGLVLRVEGRLEVCDIPELERVVDASAGAGVALDLSELRAACRSGIQALRIFGERGITLRQVPPSVALQLDADPQDPKPRSNLG
jgi:hypothetical protein